MGLNTSTCDVCGKETNDLYCFAGLEVGVDCFTTLVRVSQYNHKDWNDDEKECVSKFLKVLLDDLMVKDDESDFEEEVGE